MSAADATQAPHLDAYCRSLKLPGVRIQTHNIAITESGERPTASPSRRFATGTSTGPGRTRTERRAWWPSSPGVSFGGSPAP